MQGYGPLSRGRVRLTRRKCRTEQGQQRSQTRSPFYVSHDR
jgi:hypothetical protein